MDARVIQGRWNQGSGSCSHSRTASWAGFALRMTVVGLAVLAAACNEPKYKGTPISEFLQMVADEDADARQQDNQETGLPTTLPAITTGEYRVGSSDLLQVTIYGLETLDAPTIIPVRISEMGYIVLPLVGDVRVDDQPITAVERAIANAYAPKYIKKPRIVVEVKEYQLTKTLVIGGLDGVREVSLRRNERTIFAALARSGIMQGQTQMVYVQPRRDPNLLESYDLALGREMMQALARGPLEEGDIIVARSYSPPMYYVSGLAGQGSYPFPDKGIRLRQAVASTGGPPTTFDIDKVALVRRMRDGRDVCVVFKWKNVIDGIEPDVDLRPGDVVEIPHTSETRVEDFLRRALVFRVGVNAVYDPVNQFLPDRYDINNDYYNKQYNIRYMIARDTALRAARTVTSPLIGQ